MFSGCVIRVPSYLDIEYLIKFRCVWFSPLAFSAKILNTSAYNLYKIMNLTNWIITVHIIQKGPKPNITKVAFNGFKKFRVSLFSPQCLTIHKKFVSNILRQN